jgi:hypothetical protein
MFIWGDDCPDIDLKRFILILVYAMNWQGGYLFPSATEIAAPPANGIYVTWTKERDLYTILKHWCNEILGRFDKLLCHCTRKTAYFWDYLRGQIDLNKLRLQAGHDYAYTADRYFTEAEALAACIAIHMEPKQKLGKYYPILSAGSENSSRVNLPCRQWQKPLPELARGFIEDLVGVDPRHPEARSIRFLYDKVKTWRAPADRPRQTMDVSTRVFMNMHAYVCVCDSTHMRACITNHYL